MIFLFGKHEHCTFVLYNFETEKKMRSRLAAYLSPFLSRLASSEALSGNSLAQAQLEERMLSSAHLKGS